MRRIVVAGAALSLIGMLAACTGSSGAKSAADLGPMNAGAASGAASSAASVPKPDNVAVGAGGAGRAAGVTTALVADTGIRIRTAEITVDIAKARGVAVAADRAEGMVSSVGGEVDADERTSGSDASATLRLRVPPDQLVAVLRSLSKLGKEVTRNASSRDVTSQVADINSRVASASDSIARLRVLYARAAKVADVIAIEGELNTREADLESLQAQQRSLSRQTAMAAVTAYLRTAATPAPHHHPAAKAHGFLGGLSRGWHSFVTAATAVATGVGAALPFLVVLLLIGFAVRLLWPRLPHRSATPPTPAPAD